VILPDRNRRDLEDIPASARAVLEFVWVERAAQALDIALGETAPAAEAPAAGRHAGRAARSTARKEAPRQPGARLGSER
jgi:ATP-dependent Lon protease